MSNVGWPLTKINVSQDYICNTQKECVIGFLVDIIKPNKRRKNRSNNDIFIIKNTKLFIREIVRIERFIANLSSLEDFYLDN